MAVFGSVLLSADGSIYEKADRIFFKKFATLANIVVFDQTASMSILIMVYTVCRYIHFGFVMMS